MDIVVPVAEAMWDELEPAEREQLLGAVMPLLGRGRADRQSAGAFIRRHLGEVNVNWLRSLLQHRDIIPLTALLKADLPSSRFGRMPAISTQEADAAVKALSRDPKEVTATILDFAKRYASQAVKQDVVDRMLLSKDRDTRQRAIDAQHPRTAEIASLAALEGALKHVLADAPPDIEQVEALARRVLKLRPSEKLFPAARLLLADSDRIAVLAGIRIATSLGREDLVPALTPHLDSMDVQVRNLARTAVAQIRDIARIKQEALAPDK